MNEHLDHLRLGGPCDLCGFTHPSMGCIDYKESKEKHIQHLLMELAKMEAAHRKAPVIEQLRLLVDGRRRKNNIGGYGLSVEDSEKVFAAYDDARKEVVLRIEQVKNLETFLEEANKRATHFSVLASERYDQILRLERDIANWKTFAIRAKKEGVIVSSGPTSSPRKGAEMKLVDAIGLIVDEYKTASAKFGPFHSGHEGIGVVREEYLELEAEVFKRRRDPAATEKEAVQLGAMALRFLVDLCGEVAPQ